MRVQNLKQKHGPPLPDLSWGVLWMGIPVPAADYHPPNSNMLTYCNHSGSAAVFFAATSIRVRSSPSGVKQRNDLEAKGSPNEAPRSHIRLKAA